MSDEIASQRRVECVIPVLAVKSVEASMAWYADVLGFKKEWHGGVVGSVGRDGKSIMLGQRAGGPGEVWVGVEDIQVVYEECVTKGARIVQLPTNRPWAYEMRVEDPDGNVLWFGSEPLKESKSDAPGFACGDEIGGLKVLTVK
jgi:catechol 2,3-dioxygenase-like lactoylglutathione lyase family enzyme